MIKQQKILNLTIVPGFCYENNESKIHTGALSIVDPIYLYEIILLSFSPQLQKH